MKRKRVLRTALCTALISAALAVAFGSIYFNDRAWGAWGDDSAGYIYLAGRMFSGLPLLYHDPLGAIGLEVFGDERLARWLIPTHHQFIAPDGTVASKYPVGLSLLMALAARMINSTDGFYIVNPLAATINIILVYLTAVTAFASYRFRHAVGVLAALALGLSNLYYDHALAQPMREIPSMTFLLVMTLGVIGFSRTCGRNRIQALLCSVVTGLAFGMAITIRETSIVLLPAIVLGVWMMASGKSWKTRIRTLLPYVAAFTVSVVIALIPTIQNSVRISAEKVVFKPRDSSRVVLLSNIGHINTLSLENVFDNQGKFRPGTGALPHYWNSIQHASPIHFFLVAVVVGILFLWRESRALTIYFLLWGIGILTIFSLWINPYSRYILPLFPPLMLLGAYGVVRMMSDGLPILWKRRSAGIAVGGLLLAVAVLSYEPAVVEAKENFFNADAHIFKAISYDDVQALTALGQIAETNADKPIVLFSGDWQFGTSETFEAHTGVKTIRFPFEQRFIFDAAEVQTAFDEVQNAGYDLFVWVDETSSIEVMNWMAQYQSSEVWGHDFSFQPAVRVYQIHTP